MIVEQKKSKRAMEILHEIEDLEHKEECLHHVHDFVLFKDLPKHVQKAAKEIYQKKRDLEDELESIYLPSIQERLVNAN